MIQIDAFLEGARFKGWDGFVLYYNRHNNRLFAGAVPACSGATAIALTLPMTFVMKPVHAMYTFARFI
jgi:hypothetical protein